LEHTLATYVYSLGNICNILVYFCNIHMKQLQRTSERSKTLETYAFKMRFQRNISLLHERTEAPRHVKFTIVEFADGVEIAAPVEKVAVGPTKKAVSGLHTVQVECELCAG
jgi:hypothetical protein